MPRLFCPFLLSLADGCLKYLYSLDFQCSAKEKEKCYIYRRFLLLMKINLHCIRYSMCLWNLLQVNFISCSLISLVLTRNVFTIQLTMFLQSYVDEFSMKMTVLIMVRRFDNQIMLFNIESITNSETIFLFDLLFRIKNGSRRKII